IEARDDYRFACSQNVRGEIGDSIRHEEVSTQLVIEELRIIEPVQEIVSLVNDDPMRQSGRSPQTIDGFQQLSDEPWLLFPGSGRHIDYQAQIRVRQHPLQPEK